MTTARSGDGVRGPWRLVAGGVFLLAFGLSLGYLLSQSLRPRMGEQDTITGDFLTGTGPGGIAPGRREPVQDLERLLASGRAAYERQEWRTAIGAFKQALALDPDNPEPHAFLGLILLQGGHGDDALVAIDRALAKSPNYPFALWAKGLALFEARQDYAGAIRAWETLLAQNLAAPDAEQVAGMLTEARKRLAGHSAGPRQRPEFTIPRGAAGSEQARPLDPERVAQVITKVLPKEGYTLPIKWGDLGVKLVQLGVIDLGKFSQLYAKNHPSPDLQYLWEPSEAFITVRTENQRVLATVLWGLGLANKNPVLDKALAERGKDGVMGLASTGGWTLGVKPAAELYGKFDIIALAPEQQELVSELAQSIYRPCCDNPTALPDCNHGMALLGLIELMAANGFSREEILKASLKFNAFWFPQQYVKTALLFELRSIDWDAVEPREVLGVRYSSLRGWTQNVDRELKKVSHLLPPQAEGASCGVSP